MPTPTADQPHALWSVLLEPCPLKAVATWFRSTRHVSVTDLSGKLRYPARRVGGRSIYHVALLNGERLTIEKCPKRLYSVYETRETHESRVFREQWSEFLAGSWAAEVPTEAGTYFTRSRDGVQSTHTLVQLEDGSLRDVSGGYVQSGSVSSWLGSWWSVKAPALLGAK
jgi:hypothetical protein